MACFKHWIPACAGMTEGLRSGIRQAWQRGYRDGDKPITTPVVIPAQAGIQEGRPRSEGVAGLIGWHVRLSLLQLSFPLRGNGLCKPLDSGLRRNDGGVEVRNSAGIAKGLSGWRQTYFDPLRHSGEGRNPRLQDVGGRAASGTSGRGREAGKLRDGRVYRMANSVVVPVIVIPATREWLVSTTGFRPSPE